jgi:glycosyltransferase involved in cell wall biosynthesis
MIGRPVSAADVSLVMCVWNPRADWFREAMRSALEQTGCNIELIVVDDGSTEPVEQHLAGLADPRVRLVRTDHAGLSHARNAGTAAATGRFLRFIDGDDVLEAGSCARLLRLANGGAAISYGATLVCDDRLQPTKKVTSTLQGWIADECLLYRFEARHLSMLFPRRVVEAVGPWDTTLRQCQDWDFVLRALEHAPVHGEDEIATFYRRHGGAAAANVRGALEYESLVVDRYFERHPERRGSALEREARAKLLLVRAAAAPAIDASRRDQLGLVARAFRLHPRRTVEELASAGGALVRRRLARGQMAAQ